MERILLRVAEAAQALGISRAQAYILIRRGEIPAIRLGGSLRVPIERLQASIHERLARGERQ
jgi:excisionase family DNA binding protein